MPLESLFHRKCKVFIKFSNNFQIFKPNGTFLCDIQFDKPIQRPSDIHLTRDGKLYVSNFLLHIVSVYQLGQP